MHNEGNYKEDEKTDFRMRENNSNDTTNKGLISKIYEQLIQPNTKKNKQPNQKVGKRPK